MRGRYTVPRMRTCGVILFAIKRKCYINRLSSLPSFSSINRPPSTMAGECNHSAFPTPRFHHTPRRLHRRFIPTTLPPRPHVILRTNRALQKATPSSRKFSPATLNGSPISPLPNLTSSPPLPPRSTPPFSGLAALTPVSRRHPLPDPYPAISSCIETLPTSFTRATSPLPV